MSREQSPPWMKRTGFTLTELSIVLLIFGILSAIAIPKYNAWQLNHRIQSAGCTLIANLKQASILARTTGKKVTVHFDPIHNSYTLPVNRDEKADQFLTVNLNHPPFSVDLASGPSQLAFDPFGYATTHGRWVLQLPGTPPKIISIKKSTSAATLNE